MLKTTDKNLQYKLFWSWDHSTNWCLNRSGNQSVGANNEYSKGQEAFFNDYRRVIDWCAEHQVNALGIAGLLRDRHGGVDEARKVCAYAREKGVLVYMIAGLLAYGGVYHDGNHEYSLETFLRQNPDCLARYPDGRALIIPIPGQSGTKVVAHACPSNPKVRAFVMKSLQWAFKAIPELGGIQMEIGDTGICSCPACLKRRQHPIKPTAVISYEDMIHYYPEAVETVKSVAPDAMIICETYSHFNIDEVNGQNQFGLGICSWAREELQKQIPEDTFLQWVCDLWIGYGDWNWQAGDRNPLSRHRHIMRAHHGTYWLNYRHKLSIDSIRKHCNLSFDARLDGVSIFGEGAPYHANVEFNYLALDYFCRNPLHSTEDFARDIMADRLGGIALAERYIDLESAVLQPERLPQATTEVTDILRHVDRNAASRWIWLGSYLGSFAWENQMKQKSSAQGQAGA